MACDCLATSTTCRKRASLGPALATLREPPDELDALNLELLLPQVVL